jgi:L-rhamnonate dehydratase
MAALVVERHLARFVEGKRVTEIEKIWDQMFNATLFYGRKGLVLNAISGVDLALWDLLAKVRGEPVHQLLGGAVRDELVFYATGVRPDLAQQMGFIGGKMPLVHGPAEGNEGLARNIEQLAAMRAKVGADFWLMLDCWMSLDLDYASPARRRGRRAQPEVARGVPAARRLLGLCGAAARAAARHAADDRRARATRWGFRLLLEMGCADILQPDVGWCGGLTELIKISALADAHGASSCRTARRCTAITSSRRATTARSPSS